MSLADRLAAGPPRPRRRRRRGASRRQRRLGRRRPSGPPAAVDPFAELKRTVHQTLLDNLGPKLYDARLTQSELEQKVRQTLQEVLAPGGDAADGRPTAPASPRRSPTTSSATGRSSPTCATRTSPRSWSTGPTRSTSSGPAGSTRSTGAFTDEAHLRRTIDKIVGRVGRRVDESSPMVDARLPDGSRVNAVIPPLARRRLAAHDPQVRRRPATRSRT